MSYYQFNRQEIFQKAKKIYSKEKAAQYYLLNKEAIKKDTRQVQKYVRQKKQASKEYQRNYYKKLKAYKYELLLEKAKRGKKSERKKKKA